MIHYVLTEKDVLAANHLWRRARIRFWHVILFILLISVGVAFFLRQIAPPVVGWSTLLAISIATGLASAFSGLLAGRLQSSFMAVRYFRQSPLNHERTELVWDETHLTATQPNSHARRSWQDFHGWAENEKMLVLLLAGPLFLPVPKRTLSDGELAGIKECLTRANIRRARLFPF